jgi:hypothetical protein
MVQRLVEIQILLNTEAGEEYGDQVAYRIGVRCGSMGSRAENGSAWTPSNRCVSLKKHATLATLWRNYYERALALRDGNNNLFCCPSAYRKRAIGLRWFLGPRLRDTTRRMRSPYNFTVNISNGVVTHPNLVKFRGYVAKSSAVRASVTVQDKYASGSGRLSSTSGRGTWSGYAGNARCSGYWTAQRN